MPGFEYVRWSGVVRGYQKAQLDQQWTWATKSGIRGFPNVERDKDSQDCRRWGDIVIVLYSCPMIQAQSARGDGKILGEALASQVPALEILLEVVVCPTSCLIRLQGVAWPVKIGVALGTTVISAKKGCNDPQDQLWPVAASGWYSRAMGRCCAPIGSRRAQEGEKFPCLRAMQSHLLCGHNSSFHGTLTWSILKILKRFELMRPLTRLSRKLCEEQVFWPHSDSQTFQFYKLFEAVFST